MNHFSTLRPNSLSTHELAGILPDPQTIDSVVGEQIKARRTALGMSQKKLGEQIGVSFQQVQKYELGKNRVSSSKLFEISYCLQVQPSFFFEPLVGVSGSVVLATANDAGRKRFAYVSTREGARLVETALSLPRNVRLDLLRLMETLLK